MSPVKDARPRQSRRLSVTLGVADQAISSATNLALVIVAARRLGPGGLGVVAVGFAAAVLFVVVQRSLITDPLVVTSATQHHNEARQSARAALTMVVMAGAASGAVLFLLGTWFQGTVGFGFRLFAPWLPAFALQDYWRYLLFRDQRGILAVLNDAAWAAAMTVAAIASAAMPTESAVVATWGLGAATGALLGFAQAGILPVSPLEALRWWKERAWKVARWFGADHLASAVGNRGALLLVAALLGSKAVGGWRVTESIFAPLTLLVPAISLPGLPAVAEGLSRSLREAKRLALWLSLLPVVGVCFYILTLLAVGGSGGRVLRVVFGQPFEAYSNLIAPVAVGQVVEAAALGGILLLKAAKAGRTLAMARAIGTACGLAAVAWLTVAHGLIGAAWGVAIGVTISSASILIGARGLSHPTETPSELESAPVSDVHAEEVFRD
jgi:O-antigen/teichoic acid export membrane protein